MPNKISVLVGCNGIGDVLSSIPMVKKLNKLYNQKINVFTYVPEIYKNVPYVNIVNDFDKNEGNLAIESFAVDKFIHCRNDIRQIHAMAAGFQLTPEEMQVDFYPDEYKSIDGLPKDYIVIHPSKSWPSRTWCKDNWDKLVERLNAQGVAVVVVGKESSEIGTYKIPKPVYDIQPKLGLNLVDKINLHQTWHVLNKSRFVVTMDSGILHLAGTTDAQIIQLGSSVNPYFRAPYRKGSQDYKRIYVDGRCTLMCASDMKYNIAHNGSHNIMPPVAFCLEDGNSIGKDEDFNPSVYTCHPSVDKVFKEAQKFL